MMQKIFLLVLVVFIAENLMILYGLDLKDIIQHILSFLNLLVVVLCFYFNYIRDKQVRQFDYRFKWYENLVLPKIIPNVEALINELPKIWCSNCLSVQTKFALQSKLLHKMECTFRETEYYDKFLVKRLSCVVTNLQDDVSEIMFNDEDCSDTYNSRLETKCEKLEEKLCEYDNKFMKILYDMNC